MSITNEVIGNRLKTFRTKHRIQAQVLAKHSRISNSQLSRIENGWVHITASIVDSLLKGYAKVGIDAKAFIHGIRERVDG